MRFNRSMTVDTRFDISIYHFMAFAGQRDDATRDVRYSMSIRLSPFTFKKSYMLLGYHASRVASLRWFCKSVTFTQLCIANTGFSKLLNVSLNLHFFRRFSKYFSLYAQHFKNNINSNVNLALFYHARSCEVFTAVTTRHLCHHTTLCTVVTYIVRHDNKL